MIELIAEIIEGESGWLARRGDEYGYAFEIDGRIVFLTGDIAHAWLERINTETVT